MSPANNGYFVGATPPYDVIQIYDHAIDATQNPNRFGFDDHHFDHLNPVSNRIEVLLEVLSKGWIRVRHRSSQASIEHMADDWIVVLEAIGETIDEMKLGDWTTLVFRHVITRQELHLFGRDLRDAIASNEIDELIRRIQ